MGAVAWLRWSWRQLTSMRVALMLLLLLAVAAVPGSFFPQRGQDAAAVARFIADNPTAGRLLDAAGMFDVYSSPWFAAVYTLLFVSLIGCIVPRIREHARALRSGPPRVPRSFQRFDVRTEFTTPLEPPAAYAALLDALRRHYRARLTPDGLTAERGHLRETGNLVFHVALVGILLSFGWGQLATYRGQAIVVEGESFANAVVDYDSFQSGRLVDDAALYPFVVRLDDMESRFSEVGREEYFGASVTVREPGRPARPAQLAPNEPLRVAGTSVYLSGNGYAPRLEVRDAAGRLAFSGAVPFLAQDAVYTSTGVVKVPDVSTGRQLGLAGQLLPTAVDTGTALVSAHPQANNPLLVLQLWTGELGLDDGDPQNAYQLDTTGLTQVLREDGTPVVLTLAPGQSVELPDGLGSLSFVDLPRFAALDIRHDPSLGWLLGTSLAAIAGLMASLFTPRRRLWARCTAVDGATVVSAAALARGEDAGLRADLDSVLAVLERTADRQEAKA